MNNITIFVTFLFYILSKIVFKIYFPCLVIIKHVLEDDAVGSWDSRGGFGNIRNIVILALVLSITPREKLLLLVTWMTKVACL